MLLLLAFAAFVLELVVRFPTYCGPLVVRCACCMLHGGAMGRCMLQGPNGMSSPERNALMRARAIATVATVVSTMQQACARHSTRSIGYGYSE
jgi:hypothetical protein